MSGGLDLPGFDRSALTMAARILYREALLTSDEDDKEAMQSAASWCIYAATVLASRDRTRGEA